LLRRARRITPLTRSSQIKFTFERVYNRIASRNPPIESERGGHVRTRWTEWDGEFVQGKKRQERERDRRRGRLRHCRGYGKAIPANRSSVRSIGSRCIREATPDLYDLRFATILRMLSRHGRESKALGSHIPSYKSTRSLRIGPIFLLTFQTIADAAVIIADNSEFLVGHHVQVA